MSEQQIEDAVAVMRSGCASWPPRSAGSVLRSPRTPAGRRNPAANAARGQAGLLARFEREVDADGTLTPAERHRRAESARKAHMLRLSAASAKVRAARKGGAA